MKRRAHRIRNFWLQGIEALIKRQEHPLAQAKMMAPSSTGSADLGSFAPIGRSATDTRIIHSPQPWQSYRRASTAASGALDCLI